MILLFLFLLMSLGLMIVGYAFKRQGLVFGAVGGWMLLAICSYTLSTAMWDIYYGLFWLGVGLVFVSALEAMFIGMKDEPEEEPQDSVDRFITKQENYQKKVDRMEKAMGIRGRR